MQKRLPLAISLAWFAVASAAGAQPIPEAPQSSIEYDSVEAAMNDLGARQGVERSTQNGWMIAADDSTKTVWSFAPPGHPAYPAVVKRQVVQNGADVEIAMAVRCEAAKPDCDDLVRTFAQMNGFQPPR